MKTTLLSLFALISVSLVMIYQYHNPDEEIAVGANQALATTASQAPEAKDVNSAPDDDQWVSVNLSQEFPKERSFNLEITSYRNMKIKFSESSSKHVVISLIGKGKGYQNDGQRLADWFLVSSAGQDLKINPLVKKRKNRKSIIQSLSQQQNPLNANHEMTMIVEFPENHQFKKINIEAINSDVFASQLIFDQFLMTTVAGDLELKKSQGKKIKIETVSGDAHIEADGVLNAKIQSVSGDAFIQSKTSYPELNFESVSGDLQMQLPEDSKLNINFESMTGELVSDFGMSRKGGKALLFSSLSGSAKIKKIK